MRKIPSVIINLSYAGLLLFCIQAKALVTQYVSFDHPDGWKCELAQGVFICQSTTEPDRKESIVLSIATIAGEWDSLENYEEYLKKPKTVQDELGNTITSKVTYTRRRNINGTFWVDSLQQNSELPGFWARYLATVHNKLAILITYVVSDENYSKMAPQFERMISSLKPNAEFDLNVASQQGSLPLPGATILGPKAQKDLLSERLNVKKKAGAVTANGDSGSNTTTIAILVCFILGAFVIIKRGKKKKPDSGQKRAG